MNLKHTFSKRTLLEFQKFPVEWCREFLNANLWQKQEDILNALAVYPRVSVKSGHGVGKSYVASCTLLWYLFTHPFSKVVSTAPTHRQVKIILWSEIAKLHGILKQKIKNAGELLQAELKIAPGWFAIGFSTDQPDQLQGLHEENLLAIFDEACGISLPIFEAAEGILTSDENKALLIGNPVTPYTFFHHTHTGDEPGYHTMTVSCFDSPNIELHESGHYIDKDPLPYPKLVSMNWINRQKRSKGENSNFFKSRILGLFPDSSDDQLLDGKAIAAAVAKGVYLRKLLKKLNEGSYILSSEDIARLRG